MAKTYEEQIAAMQKKIAAIKKKQADEKKKDMVKIGQAVSDRFPEIFDMMREEGFNIFEYVKTEEFAKKVYALYKQEERNQVASEVLETSESVEDEEESVLADEEIDTTATNAGTNNFGYGNY